MERKDYIRKMNNFSRSQMFAARLTRHSINLIRVALNSYAAKQENYTSSLLILYNVCTQSVQENVQEFKTSKLMVKMGGRFTGSPP